MSMIETRAPSPAAIFAAWVPTTPPPRTSTLAGSTPGTPPSRIPDPPWGRSRYLAPAWIAIRPATSLMGVRSGSEPRSGPTVSYAMATEPLSMTARVSASEAAKWK